MYSQLIYFIVALMLFSIQQPGHKASFPPLPTFLAAMGIVLLYTSLCRAAFRRLLFAAWQDAPRSALSYRYHRMQSRLSIVALGVFALLVYFLNIKFYLQLIPGFQKFLTLSETSGLAIYLLLLVIMWFFSYPVYRHITRSELGITEFMKGQFSLQAAILFPWFFLSGLLDLSEFVEATSFLKSDSGQGVSLLIILLTFILFAPFFIVRLWGCRPLPQSPLREELEDFIHAHRFKIGNFLHWPLLGGEMPTAGIMGILPRLRYILITRGLISLLSIDELKAVVAHEMGHVRRHHLLFYLLFFLSYSVMLYSLSDLLLLALFRSDAFLRWALKDDAIHLTLFSAVYSIPILVLMVVYFRYIFGFFLRNSERQADLYAMQLLGHPFTLITSLQKIAVQSGHIEDLPSWHHFSIRQRVEFLLRSHEDPTLITRHHRKLYGMAALLFTTMAAITFGAGHVEDSSLVKNWRAELQVEVLTEEILRKPENPEFYAAYGGALLEKGRIAEAETVLLKAMEKSPRNPTVLNNLAWLYATSPPPHFDPARALELALAAVALEPAPHALDTLAEAYHVTGHHREALQTIERALAADPENKAYFQGQREKFLRALESSQKTKAE